MYKNVLEDQGKYTWQQKSENGIVKYPLKKILEKYYPEDFVYRKKVGLNNPIYHWLDNKDYRAYFLDIVNQKEGIALNFFGKNNLNKFNKPFAKENIYPGLKVLLMNLAAIQSWINYHKLSL